LLIIQVVQVSGLGIRIFSLTWNLKSKNLPHLEYIELVFHLSIDW